MSQERRYASPSFRRQHVPNRRRQIAHRGIQANGPKRIALQTRFSAIRCVPSIYERYREWDIETLFANLKTKGFNLEDTHITDPDKLSTLLAVLALTVTLCVKTGVAAARLRPIPIKKHGRRAWSLFALGVGVLRKITVSAKPAQIIAFLQQLLSSKLPVNELKSIGV